MVDEQKVYASKKKYDGGEDYWDGTCPKCGEMLGEPDSGDIHLDHGEFVAISQECMCGERVESFYDWDRTERKDRD